jgi:hypothetical protein
MLLHRGGSVSLSREPISVENVAPSIMPILSGSTARFLRSMHQLRFLEQQRQQQIAAAVFAEIQPLLDTQDIVALHQLRRYYQDERAVLLYDGARDFSDSGYAAAVLIEQWAIARAEMIRPRSLAAEVLAERCCKAIEDFVRDNLVR